MPNTRWSTLYLDGDAPTDTPGAAGAAQFDASAGSLTFTTDPIPEQTEITGPLTARLFISSSTTDADLFLIGRAFSPDGEEVTFQGALDSYSALTKGWLRASHRKLDDTCTTAYRPYRANDEIQPLTPGEIYQLDVEIWPTCVVLPPGYSVALTVQGRDWTYPGAVDAGNCSISVSRLWCPRPATRWPLNTPSGGVCPSCASTRPTCSPTMPWKRCGC